MLELTYSNRTEALLRILAERIRAERSGGGGPWEPIHLVAQDPSSKAYLRQGLARELGMAANLRFTYLDGLWRDLLADGTRRLLAFDLLRAGLLRVLGDEGALAPDAMAPVRSYLGSGEEPLKRVQLATELGRVFEEYQLSRPDWIDAWRAGRPARAGEPEQEAWQMALWRAAVQALDGAEEGVRHVTLLELVRESGLGAMRLPRAIHAFGLLHVAQAYQSIFQAFAPLEGTTLHIYALNPCGEFWEDLDTSRRQFWTHMPERARARVGPESMAADGEDVYGLASEGPMPLRLWGRPGREKIRLLNEVSECDFTSAFQVPQGDSVLACLQRDILMFREPEALLPPDRSIRCMACPSPRREAEAVATEIWRLMELHGDSQAPLRFSDIAVVVPPAELEAYAAHLEAAFKEARDIPLALGGAPPILRRTLEAASLLLDLPTSGLTRAALLRLLQHPALAQRLAGSADPSAWSLWCQELGIVRGADRKDWAGTYLDKDALHWDQGLKRLVLGQFMAEGETFGPDGPAYAVSVAREPASAAAFIAQVRGLCADAAELLARRGDPAGWLARIRAYLEKWLAPDEGEEAEAALLALERIGSYLDRVFERAPAGLGMRAIDFPAARHLALEAVERLEGEQPPLLTRGVVVASYATLRAVPFRAVFLMGNGEGGFPSRERPSALDLRRKARRSGDVSRAERDKYLFLEMVLSAREHLTLTYVGLDELTGEAFEPSGLFKEFRMVVDRYLEPAEGDPLLEVHPLRRFDPAYFPEWFGLDPAAHPLRTCSAVAAREARALAWGAAARREGAEPPPFLGALEPGPALDRLREALDTPAAPPAASERGAVRITLGELRAFLECPLTGAAAVRLGLKRRDLEDRASVEDEVFETDALGQWSLRQEAALAALRGAPPEAAYEACLARRQAQGEAPFGLFSEVERERNLAQVAGWLAHLGEGPRPETWRLGPDRLGSGAVDHALPALAFSVEAGGRPCRVELVGDLRPQLDGSLFLEKGQPPSDSGLDGPRRKALAAYLDHLALACVSECRGEHRARFVYEAAKKPRGSKVSVQELRFVFPAVTLEEAEGRLRAWIEDLLGGDHALLLPIEAVLEHWEDRSLTQDAVRAFLEEELAKGERSFASTLAGPVPGPLRFDPPGDPLGLAERRLGAYLDLVFDPSKRELA